MQKHLGVEFYCNHDHTNNNHSYSIGLMGSDGYLWGWGQRVCYDGWWQFGFFEQNYSNGYCACNDPSNLSRIVIRNWYHGQVAKGIYFHDFGDQQCIKECIESAEDGRKLIIFANGEWQYRLHSDSSRQAKCVTYNPKTNKLSLDLVENDKFTTLKTIDLDDDNFDMALPLMNYHYPFYYYHSPDDFIVGQKGVWPKSRYGSFSCEDNENSLWIGVHIDNKPDGICYYQMYNDDKIAFMNFNQGVRHGPYLTIYRDSNYWLYWYDNGQRLPYYVWCKSNEKTIYISYYNYEDPKSRDIVEIDENFDVWIFIDYNDDTKKYFRKYHYIFKTKKG